MPAVPLARALTNVEQEMTSLRDTTLDLEAAIAATLIAGARPLSGETVTALQSFDMLALLNREIDVAEAMIYNEYAQVLEAENPDTGELYQPADFNVIDFDSLRLPQPEYVNDLPNGAGRYIQGASGYDYTIVNGSVFMDHGEHTGALDGRVVRAGRS